MALKNCKECGKEVSTKAKACPGCGAPLAVVRYDLGAGCASLLAIPAVIALIILAKYWLARIIE